MDDAKECGCCAAQATSEARRRVIRIAAAGLVAPVVSVARAQATAASAPTAAGGPVAGDRLVEEDAEGAPAPLKVSDLKPGKPMMAWPFDAKANAARSDSRLNKVLLMRFAEADLDAESRARAAGGVLAFSAICTHQACDVKTWSTAEKAAICFCHSSKFKLLEGAAVSAGPATRPLPTLPLKLEGDVLVVAGGFSAAPGGTAS